MPLVTVFERSSESGLPKASTHCPTRSVPGSPKGSAGKPVPSTRSTAMSENASPPTTSAGSTRPSKRRTEISSAPSMTWLLVTR